MIKSGDEHSLATAAAAVYAALPRHKLELGRQRCLVSMWATWYSLAVGALHIYLVVVRVADIARLARSLYLIELDGSASASNNSSSTSSSGGFKSSELFGELLAANWNALLFEAVVRAGLVVGALVALGVFLASSLKQVGNYANDGVKFGRDFFHEKLHRSRWLPPLLSQADELVVNSNTLKMQQQQAAVAQRQRSDAASTIEASFSRIDSSLGSATKNDAKSTTTTNCCCRPVRSFFRSIWRHFLPVNSFAHLCSVVLLIFSQLVFPEFKSFNVSCAHLAVSDADLGRFFYFVQQQQQQQSTTRNVTAFRGAWKKSQLPPSPRAVSFVADLWSCLLDSLLGQVASSQLPVAATLLTNETSAGLVAAAAPRPSFFAEQASANLAELVSLCLALASLYIRYGSVFWFTNKTLAFLVTFIGLVGAVEQLAQLYGFVYINRHLTLLGTIGSLMKASIFDLFPVAQLLDPSTTTTTTTPTPTLELVNSTTTTTDDLGPAVQRLLGVRSGGGGASRQIETGATLAAIASSLDSNVLLRSQATLLAAYALLSVLVYLSAVPAYAFAYLKYKERFLIEESLFLRSTTRSKCVAKDGLSLDSELPLDEPMLAYQASACCFNYCPHLIATVKLVLLCALKVPFCYDFIVYYNEYKDAGIMVCIIVEILHTLILLFIWLTLTLKHDWRMHLQTPFSICHWIYHLQFATSSSSSGGGGGVHSGVCLQQHDGLVTSEKSSGPAATARLDETAHTAAQESCHSVDGPSLPPGKCRPACCSGLDTRPDLNSTPNLYESRSKTPSAEKSVVIYTHTAPDVHRQPAASCGYEKQNLAYTSSSGNLSSPLPLVDHYASSSKASASASTAAARRYMVENRHSAVIEPDYLLNSETLYRNEIRKSIRNVLNQKQQQQRPPGFSASAVQLPILIEQQQQQTRPRAMPTPSGYNTSPYRYGQLSRPVTAAAATAAVSVSSSRHATGSPPSTRSPAKQNTPTVLYLSHPSASSPSSSSSEYESRV